MILDQGIHDGIPMADYLADPCPEPSLSAGCAKTLVERTPFHAMSEHPRFGGRKGGGSKAADLGSAAHGMLLGASQPVVWIDADDYKTKKAQQARDEARANGMIPMLADQQPALDAMTSAARLVLQRFGSGKGEQTVIWQEESGIWCRARPDWLTDDGLYEIDYKTTGNADPLTWAKRVAVSMGHEYSASHYLRGLETTEGKRRDRLFLVQETEPPFLCSVVGAGPSMIDLGDRKMARAREVYAECLASGSWPGYPQEIHWADAPGWAIFDYDTREGAEQGPLTFGGQEIF